MGRGFLYRAHLNKLDRAARFGCLPGRLAPGEAAAYNRNVCHEITVHRGAAASFSETLFYATRIGFQFSRGPFTLIKTNILTTTLSKSGSIITGYLETILRGKDYGQEK